VTGRVDKQPDSLTHSSVRAIQLRDTAFLACMLILGGTYVVLIIGLLLADLGYVLAASFEGGWLEFVSRNPIVQALGKPEIRYATVLSLISSTLSAILSVAVAIPLGYLLARFRFPGRKLVDSVLDIPIVLPPLVVGLSLLILFQFAPFSWFSRQVVFQIPAVVLAQFMVAAAFAVRTMRATFDQMDPRCEQVALTLGSSHSQAFGRVVLPEARRGILTAFTLAWSRSLGEFGPLLIFAGATRMKTEVLSTTVFLEMSVGDIEAAVAVSLIMIFAAVAVLIVARGWGSHELSL
jgi:molybdate transport system permease protein